MRKIKKRSFTIEAALLMPLVLMILIGVLYLDFFVHDRAYLTAAAYEAAVSGSMEGYKKKGNIYEKADIQGRMLGDIGPCQFSGFQHRAHCQYQQSVSKSDHSSTDQSNQNYKYSDSHGNNPCRPEKPLPDPPQDPACQKYKKHR